MTAHLIVKRVLYVNVRKEENNQGPVNTRRTGLRSRVNKDVPGGMTDLVSTGVEEDRQREGKGEKAYGEIPYGKSQVL